MKSSVFWDMRCNLLKVNQHFGEYVTTIFRVSQIRNQHEGGSRQDVIAQKMELFKANITQAARNQIPTTE
jgi:hypothetical protein